jgi:hypothetical protein
MELPLPKAGNGPKWTDTWIRLSLLSMVRVAESTAAHSDRTWTAHESHRGAFEQVGTDQLLRVNARLSCHSWLLAHTQSPETTLSFSPVSDLAQSELKKGLNGAKEFDCP